MSQTSETLALTYALATCLTHHLALSEAIEDLDKRQLSASDLEHLDKDDRRLLDQFAYRYTRLQDQMGARLLPSVLMALGEEISTMSVLDRLDRLEALGWLPSADEWVELRKTRNEFTHDYPETVQERYARFQHAVIAAFRLCEILRNIHQRSQHRFPDIEL